MNRVAKYRKIYPPRTDSNSVRTTLNEAINHYIELFNKPNNDQLKKIYYYNNANEADVKKPGGLP